MTAKRLDADMLRWQPDKEMKALFKNPEKIAATKAIVGQERAVEALDLGLKLYRPGYNIYVAGIAGTGRITTIRRALEQIGTTLDAPPDRCYVYNFVDAAQPVLLNFPSGKGRTFKDDMGEFIRVLRAEVPKAIDSPNVQKERDLIVERYQRQEKKLFEEFAEELKKEGFALIQVQEGGFVSPTVFPIVGKEAVSIDYLENLVREEKMTKDERDEKIKRHKELSSKLKRVLGKARVLGKEMNSAVDGIMQRSASVVLDGLMEDLRSKYSNEKVRKYLLRVKSHILKNIDAFSGKKDSSKDGEGIIILGGQKQEDHFWYYEVNLLYDQQAERSNKKHNLPIVEEMNPTYSNLLGSVEFNIGPGGYWNTDFRHIKAGSLLKADGGYLIVNAMDLLKRPMVWDQLKRVLKTEKLVIQQPETYFQMAPMSIKPEPIDLTVKVIVVGPGWIYRLLYDHEEDFPKTFKVLSDFDTTMPLTLDSAGQYASVLKAVCDRGDLKPFHQSGLLAMIEHGVEESGQRDRISTKFSFITDILREADYWAGKMNAKQIEAAHVERAVDEKRKRHGLIEQSLQRMIEEGVILIDSRGKRVAQVNGLSVYTMGHVAFGKPSRVTASTSVGRAGVINVERESKLSGPIHDKGVLILTGYLRQKYAQRQPMNLTASVCFEQSYGGVDGDSASSTEIYALLSALSGMPIRQDIAVTGSVNQLGDIQPIGGANEKIAGFYDVCKAHGLTGTQGVLIPVQNERHLMLRRDIIDAVREGKFHIYSVKSIDEGIELLTGTKAGVAGKDGAYPANTIHGMVAKRLNEINEAVKAIGGTPQPIDAEIAGGKESSDKIVKKKKASKKKAVKKKVVKKKKVTKKKIAKKKVTKKAIKKKTKKKK